MNKSLHAIPVQSIFIMKKGSDGRFYYLQFVNLDNPITIDSWNVKRFEMEPFTIMGRWNQDIKTDYHDLTKDAMIGLKSGDKLIWVKPHKKAPASGARRALKEHQYQNVSVWRKVVDGVTLSKAVDVRILIRMKDLNGQTILRKYFGITGYDKGHQIFLSDELCGYNTISCKGKTTEEISSAIQKQFGLDKDNISVHMIDAPKVFKGE